MMKFSRSYERSILVYRQVAPGDRIMMSLGRSYEDGECRPDSPRDIPDDFELVSYIITRDPKSLLEEIRENFADLLDADTKATFRSAVFDALKLQEKIVQEMKLPGGSDILRRIEMTYGKQVIESILAASMRQSGDKSLTSVRTSDLLQDVAPQGWLSNWIVQVGFLAIIVFPIVFIATFRPETFTLERETDHQSLIISLASQAQTSDLPIAASRDEQADLKEEARARKQVFYLSSGFGELNALNEYERQIFLPQEDVSPEGQDPAAETGADARQDDAAARTSVDVPPEPAQAGEADAPASPLPGGNMLAEVATTPAPTERELLLIAQAKAHGIPDRIGRFAIRGLRTYDAGDPLSGIEGLGVSATYDLARRAPSILSVVPGDLLGLPGSLDRTMEILCREVIAKDHASTAGADSALEVDSLLHGIVLSASLSFDLGHSDFIAVTADTETCNAQTYTVFPLFEIVIENTDGVRD